MKPPVTNRDLYEELQAVSKLSKKQRHQVKSRWYYLFWGAATVSVFAGQLYVGTGYRRMSRSIERILDAPIILDIGPKHRMMDPMYDDPMIIR